MDKVHKTINTQYYTASSKPLRRIHSFVGAQTRECDFTHTTHVRTLRTEECHWVFFGRQRHNTATVHVASNLTDCRHEILHGAKMTAFY
jgi:hypothetical protein